MMLGVLTGTRVTLDEIFDLPFRRYLRERAALFVLQLPLAQRFALSRSKLLSRFNYMLQFFPWPRKLLKRLSILTVCFIWRINLMAHSLAAAWGQ